MKDQLGQLPGWKMEALHQLHTAVSRYGTRSPRSAHQYLLSIFPIIFMGPRSIQITPILGRVDTFNLKSAISPTDSPDFPALRPQKVGYSFNENCTWISNEGKNILWLPPEYRPISSAITETAVAIGCLSGRVLILTFPEGNSFS